MDRNSVDWYGNFCAVVTPFNRGGNIDEAAFQENIRLLVSEGIRGIVVAGCTGEFWALSDGERLRLFELAREATDVFVIGNASAIVTGHSVAYAQGAKDRALDGIMLTPPFYARPNDREIVHHYRRVSDAVELPILMYNIPSRQAVAPSIGVIEQLVQVDNVVAFKQSASEFGAVLDTLRAVGDAIRVMPGHSVDRGVPCLVMGADGYVSSVESQVMGRDAVRMYELVMEGNLEEARDIQMRCVALDKAIHGDAGTFPASLKAAMNFCGRPGGYPREPLLPLTEQESSNLRATLQGIGIAVDAVVA